MSVNYRSVGIFVILFIMLISPSLSGIIFEGQTVQNKAEENSNCQPDTIKIYHDLSGDTEEIDFDEYICSVVLAEVPSSFENEALKAMSVAVRSYCLRRMGGEKKVEHMGADVCDDYTHCMGYISFDEAKIRWGEDRATEYYEKVKNAVLATSGEVLYYGDELIDAVFHASSDDMTESAENIWGFDIPYLVSVSSPEDVEYSYADYTSDELVSILENEGFEVQNYDDKSLWIGDIVKNDSGRVEKMYLCGNCITGRRIREIFGLKSAKFTLKYDGENFKFEALGSGHGVGMSQYGCNKLATEGMAYKDILCHYYKGVEVLLYKG